MGSWLRRGFVVFSLLILGCTGNGGLADPTASTSGAQAGTAQGIRDLLDAQTPATANAESILAATVAVRSGVGRGSGAIVREDGLILTAAHVAGQPGEDLFITLSDGRAFLARTLGCDHLIDVALAKIEEEGPFPFAPLGEPPADGEWIAAAGHPGGLQDGRGALLRVGRVLGRQDFPGLGARIITDAPLVNGDSGGPLFSLDGRVIGVNTSASPTLVENNQHAPVDKVRARWDALLAGEEFGAPLFAGLQAAETNGARQARPAESLENLPDGLREMIESGEARVLKQWSTAADADDAGGGDAKPAAGGGQAVAIRLDPNDEEALDQLREYLESPQRRMIGAGGEITILQRDPLRSSPETMSSVAGVAAEAGASVVEVSSKGEVAALGVVVRADGLVATKASELDRDVAVHAGGETFDAEIVARDAANDVAMLRAEGLDLPAVEWSHEPAPRPGRFLVTPGARGQVEAIGVVSHGVIADSAQETGGVDGATLQATFERALGEARVKSASEDGAADKAGLRAGDVIVALDGEPIGNAATLDFLLQGRRPGERATLSIMRDGEPLEVIVTLAERRAEGDSARERAETVGFVSRLSGELSERRDGFPRVFLHDSVIDPRLCGGPLVDLDGRVIGLNIARVDRTSTAAIPADHAASVIKRLIAAAVVEQR